MPLQLSSLLSVSILALSGMVQAQFPFPTPGVTLTYADGTSKHFDFDTCIPATNPFGSDVVTAVFTEAAVCTLFNQDDCEGISAPLPFPPLVPIPNPFVAGFIVNSAQCSSV